MISNRNPRLTDTFENANSKCNAKRPQIGGLVAVFTSTFAYFLSLRLQRRRVDCFSAFLFACILRFCFALTRMDSYHLLCTEVASTEARLFISETSNT